MRNAPGADYPLPSSEAVSRAMKGNTKTDTRPEVRLRSELHSRRARFRKNAPIEAGDIRVRVDILFTKRRLAVFLDGCFWHGCPQHGNWPRANAEYWTAKIKRNLARDVRVSDALRQAGWTVVRIWEHEPPSEAADRVISVLTGDTRC